MKTVFSVWVYYKGCQSDKKDALIEAEAKAAGLRGTGTGFNFNTNERDLSFSCESRVIAQGFVKRIKGLKKAGWRACIIE